MGLDLTVGVLIDSRQHDVEGFTLYQTLFTRLNEALQAERLPGHTEPPEARGLVPWSCQMWGYSGLHYLRRIAAHLWAGNELPEPGNARAAQDPVLDECYSFLHSLTSPNQFQHLLFHSDAAGFYVPLPFRDVIYPPDALQVPGGMIGSSIALLEECKRLAAALELPDDLACEAEVVWNAASHQGQGDSHWQRYGIESFTCLRLLQACRISIESGCAIVFH